MPPFENAPAKITAAQLATALGPLPPMAQVLARAQSLLASPGGDLDDVARLLRLDAAMTTRIIKISNSAVYGRGSPCNTLDEAVNRVGFKEVLRLVSVVAARTIVAVPLVIYDRDPLTLWRESVACAFAAEAVAGQVGEDAAASFMNGLLHAIGRQAFNRHFEKAGVRLADTGFPLDFSAAESALAGFTQSEVGAFILADANFTSANVEPIRRQYQPLDAPDPFNRLGAVLYAARLLRAAICEPDLTAASPEEEVVLGFLALRREDVLALEPAVRQQLARAEKIAAI